MTSKDGQTTSVRKLGNKNLEGSHLDITRRYYQDVDCGQKHYKLQI